MPLLAASHSFEARRLLTMEAFDDSGQSWSTVKKWVVHACNPNTRPTQVSRPTVVTSPLVRAGNGGWLTKQYRDGVRAGAKRMSVVQGAIGHAVDTISCTTDATGLLRRKLRQRLGSQAPRVAGVGPGRVASVESYKNAVAERAGSSGDAKFLTPSNIHVVRGKGGGVFVDKGLFPPNQVMTITGLTRPEWTPCGDGNIQEAWLRHLLSGVSMPLEQCEIGWHEKKQMYYGRLAFEQERLRDNAAAFLQRASSELGLGWKVYERRALTRVTQVMTQTRDAVKRELDETSQLATLRVDDGPVQLTLLLWADACGNMTAVKGRVLDSGSVLWSKGRSPIFDCIEFIGITLPLTRARTCLCIGYSSDICARIAHFPTQTHVLTHCRRRGAAPSMVPLRS